MGFNHDIDKNVKMVNGLEAAVCACGIYHALLPFQTPENYSNYLLLCVFLDASRFSFIGRVRY